MEQIPKSGYYYANKIVRLSLKAFEEVMGKNGLNAILNLAHLPQLIDNPPPDNLERAIRLRRFCSINWALEEMYGPRGGRGLALRAGRAAFADALRNFGALAGVGDLAFKVSASPNQAAHRYPCHGPDFQPDQRSALDRQRRESTITSIPSIAARCAGEGTTQTSRYVSSPMVCSREA